MANFEEAFNKLYGIEGGYNDRAADRGGATNYGISLATLKRQPDGDLNGDGVIDKEDVKLIDKPYAMKVAKRGYWDLVWGDRIVDQEVAYILFDIGYNSGPETAVKYIQRIYNAFMNFGKDGKLISNDGIMGPETFRALEWLISKLGHDVLIKVLKSLQTEKYLRIVEGDKVKMDQVKNLRGWFNRMWRE